VAVKAVQVKVNTQKFSALNVGVLLLEVKLKPLQEGYH